MQTVSVVTAVVAALLFGISSVADQRSTKRVKTERTLSPAILVDLAREPLWLFAIVANLGAFALQVVALSLGSLAVVQPLLVFDLVFAVLIGRTILFDPRMFPPGAKRWDPVLFAGVGAATLGVAGFLAIGRPTPGHADVGFSVLLPLGVGLVVVVGGCLAVAARNENLRPLALALGCGVCYGVAAFSVKLVTTEASGGAARVFTNWPIYVLAITGPVGFILNQDAFQQGRFLAPVQAILTTTDPIISIGLSILWLGSRLQSSPGAIAGVVISLLVMTAGIVITAHRAPQAPKDRDMNDSSHPPVPKQGAEPRRAAAGQDLPEAAEVSAESTPRRGSSGGITGTSPRTPPWSPTSSACCA